MFGRLSIAVLLLVWCAVASLAQAPPASPAEKRLLESLARELIDHLQASGKFSTIKPSDARTLVARTHDGSDVSVNLANTAFDVAARPAERTTLVQRLVRVVLSSIEQAPLEIDRDTYITTLRILVRHRDYFKPFGDATATTTVSTPPAGPIWRPLAGDAVAIVVTTNGEQITSVMQGSGSKYGLDDDGLFDLALQQMGRYVEDHSTEDAGGLRVFLAGDESYSPSLLLLSVLWAKVERDFGADFIVAIPDRTVLLAAPARNADGLTRAVGALMQERKAQPHISHFIQRADGGWRRFK